VVLVPRDADEVRRIVPAAGDDLRQIAAVTAAELGPEGGPPLGERIVVVPAQFAALDARARTVVVRHELTHLATGPVTSSSTPFWLSEGFADHVGHLGSGEAPASAAGELAAEIRAGKVPDRLPGEGDFAAESPRLAQAYQSAWLACRLIAERVGEDGLARFYRTVSGGPGDADASLDSGLRSVLGLTTDQFVALWRAYLRARLA
jgi:hypothetical protein